MDNIQDMFSVKHFSELSTEVQLKISKYGWFSKHGYELLVVFIRLALFASSFAIFAQPGWWFKVIGMILISYQYFGIGITGTHETRHMAFLASPKWNKAWAYFFSDFWANQANEWWFFRHVQEHHAYTNIPDRDPPSFTFPWIPRLAYFFVIPYFLPLWLFYHSFNHVKKNPLKLFLFLSSSVAGWLFHVWIFTFFVPSLGLAILCMMIMRTLFAPVFMHIAIFNHIGLEDPETRLPWLPHQTRTTRNLKPHFLLNGMGGNAFIECHIEHHLFPRLSNHMLTKIRPIVMKYVKKEGYKYVEDSYMQCLYNSIKYYKELFKYGPPDPIELV